MSLDFTPSFGRLPAPDERDRLHPMRALLSARAFAPTSRTWEMFRQALNQGMTSQCCAYAFCHLRLALPVPQRKNSEVVTFPALYAQKLYDEAQKVDEWPGEGYDGTSVRAVAKVLAAQGIISEYVWAFDVATAEQFVLSRGPVVMGTAWHAGMMQPDAKGYIHPTGAVYGGHAYVLIGYSAPRQAFRVVNSWGPSYGERGRAWLHRDEAATLLASGGECVSAVEIKAAA